VLQSDSSIQHAIEDGVADGAAPQHAGITGLGVVLIQFADPTGRFHESCFVIEVSQCHGAVRISDPLPAVRLVSLCSAAESVRAV